MVRNQCNAQVRFADGAVYVCTKSTGHSGPHHAYDATTDVEFYRDNRLALTTDCALPGCRTQVVEPGDVCAGCVDAFGPMLRPGARLTPEQIAERDAEVRAAYAEQVVA